MAGFLPIIPCSHSIPGTLALSSTNIHTFDCRDFNQTTDDTVLFIGVIFTIDAD